MSKIRDKYDFFMNVFLLHSSVDGTESNFDEIPCGDFHEKKIKRWKKIKQEMLERKKHEI